MLDKITIQYADGTPEEFSGNMINDSVFPELGLKNKMWINYEEGYSVSLEIRKLDPRFFDQK